MTREEQIVEAGKTAAEGKEFSVLVNKQRRTMSAYEIGFIEGAEWADSHPHWIPVEEMLPEKENEFEDYSKLVVVTNGKDFWKGMYNYGGEDWRTFDLWLIDDATHWMEIVPPAEKGGSDE